MWVSKMGLRSLFLIGIFICFASTMLNNTIQPNVSCDAKYGNMGDTDTWSISSSDTHAKILWQVTRHLPTKAFFDDSPNSGIVASENLVVFRDEEWKENSCKAEGGIVALNLNTGKEMWRLPSPPPEALTSSYANNFRDLKAMSDGYILVTNGQNVLKFDDIGKILWTNRELPTRQIRTVYVYADKYLMLRSRSVVYVLSAQTGEYLNTLSIPNVVAHYGGFYLTGDAKLQKIFGFESGYPTTPLFTIQAPNGQIITDAQSLLYPFTDFTQNGFFVYNDTLKPDQVLAYDTLGNKQWQINEKLLTFPVLLVHHVVVYSIDGLKIYNYNTGKLEYTIRLKRNSPNNETVDEPNSVWIAVYKNIVVLYFRKFWDMVALQVDELQ